MLTAVRLCGFSWKGPRYRSIPITWNDKHWPTVVGRKNWLFNFTEAGARYAAVAYSLIQSCILAKVDPMVYFIDVLQRIDTYPAADIHLLTPRMWAQHFAQSPMRSIAHRGLDFASSLKA